MMNAPRLIAFVATFLLVLGTATARGEEPGAGDTPTRFRQLLQVGGTVLLRPFSDHPACTVQLLSDAQAEEVKTAYAAYAELRQRRDEIMAQLDTEGRVNERVAIFVQQEALAAKMASVPDVRQLGTYAYEVAEVGGDFVTLKKPGIEKYVPLHSIREIYRADELYVTVRRRPSGLRGSSPTDPPRVRTTFRLKNTTAAEVAAAVRTVYPDSKLELTVDAASNSLVVVAERSARDRIRSLIDILDAPSPEATSPIDKLEP